MQNNIVVYTTIFGPYDELLELNLPKKNVDFICFTDQKNLKSRFWNIVYVNRNENANILNRRYKWLPHLFLPSYTTSIYIDANLELLVSAEQLIAKYLHVTNIAIPESPSRSCVYEEAEACIKNLKTTPKHLIPQIKFYTREEMPVKFGLWANRLIIRNHNKAEIKALMDLHWQEFQRWETKRDQLSFPFIVWKNNKRITTICLKKDKIFRVHKHKTKNNKNLIWKILRKARNEFLIVFYFCQFKILLGMLRR